MDVKKMYILVIGLAFGILLIMQTKSYNEVTDDLARDVQTNVFQEIQVLKDKNADLKNEISELEDHLEQLNNQDESLGAIETEINGYKLLSGKFAVVGPGVEILLNGDVTMPWLIDLVNAVFVANAEAVSVNGIRIVNHTAGFDTLPQGQILLNGSILSPPYEITAIGESSVILDFLELPGGIFDKIEATFPDLEIMTEEMDVIKML